MALTVVLSAVPLMLTLAAPLLLAMSCIQSTCRSSLPAPLFTSLSVFPVKLIVPFDAPLNVSVALPSASALVLMLQAPEQFTFSELHITIPVLMFEAPLLLMTMSVQ